MEPRLPYFHTCTKLDAMNANDIPGSTRAWSVTTDADGKSKFFPERFGPDQLRKY